VCLLLPVGKKKKRNTTVKCDAARCATWSHWRRPDLRLEHPQHVGEEGSSVTSAMSSSSSGRRPATVDLRHEDDDGGCVS
jgi:hypothetical protein